MSRYTGRLPRTYDAAVRMLKNRSSRVLSMPNTTLTHNATPRGVGAMIVRHHGTAIAAFYEDGVVEINSQGHFSASTKERLNAMVPDGFGFCTRDYVGKIITPGNVLHDGDGLRFDADGAYSVV